MSAYQYLDLVNLSATGAKLRGAMVPETGKPAIFRLDHVQVLCKVIWAKGELCGVRFDELIPPRVLSHLLEVGSTSKLGLLTPDEQQAGEEWTIGNAP
jgi:hypothetical protein